MSFPPCLLVDAVEQFLCQRYAFLTVDRYRAFLRGMPELSVAASLSVNVPSVLLEHPDDFDYFERLHISVLYQRFKDSAFANNMQIFCGLLAVVDENRGNFPLFPSFFFVERKKAGLLPPLGLSGNGLMTATPSYSFSTGCKSISCLAATDGVSDEASTRADAASTSVQTVTAGMPSARMRTPATDSAKPVTARAWRGVSASPVTADRRLV